MNNFTQGDWRTNQRPHGKVSIVGHDGFQICLMWNSGDRDSNAHLIATAGTTATKLAEAGYDAVKVLEVLPKILHCIDSDEYNGVGKVNAALEIIRFECKPKASGE